MKAINHTEAQTIHTSASTAPAVLLEAADLSKNLILVPLSRLVSRPMGGNVRKTPRMSIPELAASIQRIGLLQNLIVTATADGERYEVVAGGRRQNGQPDQDRAARRKKMERISLAFK